MKNNKKGLVVWLTGLPCSGKTSIAKELEKYFKDNNIPVQRLDGDIVRGTINSDLGFSKKDRDENIRRVTHIAKMLSDNGVNAVVAFVSPYQKMRDFARETCPNFVEVHINCSIEECKKRDVKGMYAKALAGEIKDFTGVQDPYEIPENPEIKVDTEKKSLDESVGEILEYLKSFEK
ncbi:MAG: adenylyl-sulfate kinase [Candidatus Moranbacteria bacterium]|jgi:adenylyl-sulfate kinase|nr:adenylyl-sulfate kinase [Candidatus Moranbacteria bacterium]